MDRQPQLWEKVLNAVNSGQQPASDDWQQLTPEEQELIESLRQQKMIADAATFLDGIAEDEAWTRLSGNIRKHQSTRVIRFMKYAAVFAGVIVLGASSLLLLKKDDAPQPVIAGKYITPAVNPKRAVLVLDDGRNIELDKTRDSKIQQGQVVVTNVDTTLLKYTATNAIKPAGYNTLVVPRGGQYKIELADGTQVWLNAETQLRYPAHFGGVTQREVFLEHGEAYFKVAPNAKLPFTVRADGTDVKVLGTEFNINTYTKNYVATLVNGSVSVNAGTASTTLRPDQQAIYTEGRIMKRDVDVEPYVAWIEGQLIFIESSLEDVMMDLGRQYDLTVEFASPELKERRFGGRLRKTQHIEDVLAVIGKVGNVQFSIKGKTIYVSSGILR